MNTKKTLGLAVIITALAINYKYDLFAMIELTPDQATAFGTLPIQNAMTKKCPNLKQKFVEFMYKTASTPIPHTQGINTLNVTNAALTLTASSLPYNPQVGNIESYQARVYSNTGALLYILPFYSSSFTGGLSPIEGMQFISNHEIVLSGNFGEDLKWDLQILAGIKDFLTLTTVFQCELLQALDILYSRMMLGKPDQPLNLTQNQWTTFATFPAILRNLFLGRFIQAQ